jgi:hypothetical protein
MSEPVTLPTAEPVRWVTATVLAALAERHLVAGSEFTAAQLATWVQPPLTAEQRVHASSRLCSLGFLRHRMELQADVQVDIYALTPDGQQAVEAAAAGQVRKSGPKGSRKPSAPPADAFSTRLWNLMRIRKMLTPAEGAELLGNAGDDDFERRRATARKCLRRWANAGALQESVRRVGAGGQSNGDKRYVLVKDSTLPPNWHQATKPGRKLSKTGGAA